MAEALGVVASGIAVAQLAGATASAYIKLRNFIRDVKIVDETVESLCSETAAFNRLVEAVKGVIDKASSTPSFPPESWEPIEEGLKACSKTMVTFSKKVDLLQSPTTSRPLRDAQIQFKLIFSQGAISGLRSQISTHASSLQMIIGTINFHLLGSVDVKTDKLEENMAYIIRALETRRDPEPVTQSDPEPRRINLSLRQVAEMVLQKSGSILASSTAGPMSTTGSEFGERLSVEKLHHISNWTRGVFTIPEDLELQGMPMPSGSEDQRLMLVGGPEPDRSATIASDDLSTVTSLTAPDDMDSDDDEIDYELVQQAVRQARTSIDEGKYDTADKFLRIALEGYNKLGKRRRAQIDQREIKRDLAAVCVHQDNLADAETLCYELGKISLDDAGGTVPIDATHLLAQINLRRGNIRSAKQHCSKVMSTRKRLQRDDATHTQAYNESIALMAAICRYDGDTHHALLYEGLLPPRFASPEFKGPMLQSPLDNTSGPELPQSVSAPTWVAMSEPSMGVSEASETENTRGQQTRDFAPTILASSIFPIKRREVPKIRAYLQSPETLGNPVAYTTAPLEGAKAGLPIKASSATNSRRPSPVPALESERRASYDAGNVFRTAQAPPTVTRLPGRVKNGWPVGFAPLIGRMAWVPTDDEQEQAFQTLLIVAMDCKSKTFDPFKAFTWAVDADDAKVAMVLIHGWAVNYTTIGIRRSTHVKVKFKEGQYRTTVARAVRNGSVKVLRLMLEQITGLDPDSKFSDMAMNSMRLAIREGQTDVAVLLLRMIAGRDELGICLRSKTSGGGTLLHFAALHDNGELTTILCALGSDMEMRTDSLYRSTPLRVAAKGNKIKALTALLECGANPRSLDDDGYTLLHAACKEGGPEAARLLIDSGVPLDVRTTDDGGFTALHMAVMRGRDDIVHCLIGARANVNIPSWKDQYTALHLAVLQAIKTATDASAEEREFTKSIIIVKLLLHTKPNLEATDRRGFTPLLLAAAAKSGASLVILRLLEAGARIEHTNEADVFPLMAAVQSNNFENVKVLIDAGASIRTDHGSGRGLLDLARYCEDSRIFPYLARQRDAQRSPGRSQR